MSLCVFVWHEKVCLVVRVCVAYLMFTLNGAFGTSDIDIKALIVVC